MLYNITNFEKTCKKSEKNVSERIIILGKYCKKTIIFGIFVNFISIQ